MRGDGRHVWTLIGLSFLYGIFHAAGPGHGKAVITTWILASGETLRRGVVVSFAAAFAQAATAIVLVGMLAGFVGVTAMGMSRATNLLEIASFALIAAVGAWLLFSRIAGRGHRHDHGPVPALAAPAAGRAGAPFHHHRDDAHHDRFHADHAHSLARSAHSHARSAHDHASHQHDGGHHHDHGHGHDHSHSHAPDPARLAGPLTLGSAAAAVAAVGIRPCTGAIIVLVFALSQGLYAAGIVSVLLMAVGTGLTVSLLAGLAVGARDVALRLVGAGTGAGQVLYRTVEIGAALAVLLFGLLMLGGALSGGGIG